MTWFSILKNVRVTANAIVQELENLGFVAKVDYVDPILEGLSDSFSISVYKNETSKDLSVIKYFAVEGVFRVSAFGDGKWQKVDSVSDVIDLYERRLGDVA
tara:strand:+ start:442 stop:744 length:303 start_codon:yes stop_codon:yes gene_type:complete